MRVARMRHAEANHRSQGFPLAVKVVLGEGGQLPPAGTRSLRPVLWNRISAIRIRRFFAFLVYTVGKFFHFYNYVETWSLLSTTVP